VGGGGGGGGGAGSMPRALSVISHGFIASDDVKRHEGTLFTKRHEARETLRKGRTTEGRVTVLQHHLRLVIRRPATASS
jgi:hypothetical protein